MNKEMVEYLKSQRTQTQEEVDTKARDKAKYAVPAAEAWEAATHHAESQSDAHETEES